MAQKSDTKKLYRSRQNRMIAGVCGGMADYFKIDATVVRILWLIFSLINGIGILAYFVCMLLIPDNPHEKDSDAKDPQRGENILLIIGIFLIAIGVGFLFRETFDMAWPYQWPFFFPLHLWHFAWPVLLILFGGFILYRAIRDRETGEDEKKVVYKSRQDRMLGGVISGLAQRWNIDASILRIAYVILTLLTHVIFGVLVYILLVLVLPEEPEGAKTTRDKK